MSHTTPSSSDSSLKFNLQGQLLVASPNMIDGPFSRAVVLVLQQNESGTFGVVLNRKADERVSNLWNGVTGLDGPIDQELFRMGGPMGGPVFAVHRSEGVAEFLVVPGIFVTANTKLINYLAVRNETFRIFVGLSGWQVGQLEREINQGIWFKLPADGQEIFGNSDCLWETALYKYGRNVWRDVLKLDDRFIEAIYN
ncbi:MAG TPA: YqgE/AlgH family protein [Pirellulaceae bacterium]|mgnify:CR=1 FL=1|nr:YqgE/AlgH family protein [Pirellulaceae bacterium]HMO92409.1 YqgE/AlgH family protein [Pirellulaceae bacterium]HMP69528.1 YqgE/AlgH family protein [Pirellulaceae bacterium]